MYNNDYSTYLDDNKLAIFLFHGVISKNLKSIRNYNNKHITKKRFSNIIGSLVRTGNPVSMAEVIEYCNGKVLPERSFAITFDDGFKNNLDNGLPILEKYNVPATIYITTNFIETNQMSWIDRIEWAFEKKDAFNLNLPWNNFYSKVSSYKIKKEILEQIRDKVKRNNEFDPNSLADDIQLQLNLPLTYTSSSELDQKLLWKDLKILISNPKITIGGHTHTHRILSYLNNNDLEYEISNSINLIKKNLKLNCVHYSYPEGLEYCYNKNVISYLKKNGILCCPTALHGLNRKHSDPFQLKRITVT